MVSPRQIALALLALLIGGGAAVFFRTLEPAAEKTIPPATPASDTEVAPAPSSASPEPVVEGPAPAAPDISLPTGDIARDAITELSITYDAAAVPALARYLKHPDPDIRAAARDGLINLGERAAIPFLEAAAKTALADEAVLLREAAEFLALPTWTEQREARKKAKAAGATGP